VMRRGNWDVGGFDGDIDLGGAIRLTFYRFASIETIVAKRACKF
jgi:hypothetical protein